MLKQHNTKTALYFTFGRFQPCTIAHEAMFKFIQDESQKNNADYSICISPTHDNVKNVFTWEERIALLKEAMPQLHTNTLKESRLDNLIKNFVAQGYKDLVFVVGNDRVTNFQWIYKYKDDLGYNSFTILEYGNRTECAVSATNARLAAKQNNYTEFRNLVAVQFADTQVSNMYNTIKERLL